MRVGLIGVGKMGTGIGLNILKAGHSLVSFDIRPEQLVAHVEAGATAVDSPGDVAQNSDVVFTSLPGPEEVEVVSRGPLGLLDSMRPGQAYFDLSTSPPSLVRSLHQAFLDKGVAMLDAPVSGGPFGAASGKLAMWVSGDKRVYEKFLPLLNAMGDEICFVGESGAGSIAKLVHNATGFVLYAALAETFSMGMKAGLDADVIWETVRKGLNGRRPLFDCLARNFMPSQYDDADFSLTLAAKDARLANELAAELGVPMPLAKHAYEELKLGIERGWGSRDARVAMLLQLERAGLEPLSVSQERIDEILGD